MDLREAIIQIVTDKQGCKATELAPLIAEGYPDLVCELDKVVETIESLVASGELVEVEYILPQMTYRIKSMLFPKGTEVQLRLQLRLEG